MTNIDPFDIVSGKTVQNENGTFWFKEPGNNMQEDGWPIWKNLYRDNDFPAIIYADGTQYWYKNGKKHRDNGPAIIEADGTQYWYKNGKKHRDNGPAIIEADGTHVWYKNSKRHRDNDLPAVIWANGSQLWYKDDCLHRDNELPAIIRAGGSQEWYKNGERYFPAPKTDTKHYYMLSIAIIIFLGILFIVLA